MKRQLLEIQLDYIYKSLLFERSSPGGLGGTPMKRQLLEIQLDYIYKPLLFERSSPGGLGGTPMKRQLLEIQRVKKLTLTPVYILYAVPSCQRKRQKSPSRETILCFPGQKMFGETSGKLSKALIGRK